MEIHEAVAKAKGFVRDLFEPDGVRDLGLEEVEFADGLWVITIGFSRPWDTSPIMLAAVGRPRTYKVVRIDASDGHLISILNRESHT